MELIKVAIADPDTLLREGLKRILAAERDLLVVGEAAGEVEVAEVMERTTPDVLLLDLKIPRREAVPVLLELNQKNIPTKVFILSLFPEEESILNTAKAGACGYILKSASPATLIYAIRRVHRGEIWADKQLDCAETFVEFARQTWTDDADGGEDEIFRALSKREREILGLVAKGSTNEEIRKTLFISLRTVKVHLNHVFNKLGVNNRTQAALLFVNPYPQGLPGELGWRVKDVEQLAGKRPGIKQYQHGKQPISLSSFRSTPKI